MISVVIVHTIYVPILADGFLFSKSLIVGKNHKKVITPPAAYKNVKISIKALFISYNYLRNKEVYGIYVWYI